ncbi:DUF3747 domain-containing protein [Trichothermofontia sichuanensis B231]|uniref:DUF3747 domain-containing protein n=1 Tax=Trichothermofontia sichuanensis TaxID=3045816 RepID=UPI0022479C97|nr:DUF3747 domain-containing protein [Trichothermofontia sichuanensis]UZQ53617.1 DUF3747 domain-containing protein [Trichothermofontia sichuanensis B231]
MNSASRSLPVRSWVVSVLTMAPMVGALLSYGGTPAIAAPFEQVDVDQSRFIAIAAPVGNSNNYQLLILEQVAESRPCWQVEGSQPAIVDPLLLQFDFTGICGRSTDSNGYSVRLAGEDYALQYSLRVQRQENDLLLLAIPFRRQDAPTLVVGRTHGIAPGFMRLDLDPGWRFTKRSFNGQRLGHIYLTHDRSLQELAQLAAPLPPSPPPTRQQQTPMVSAALPTPPAPEIPAAMPATPTAPSTPVTAAREVDQPIIIPVPPPASSPTAPVNTSIRNRINPSAIVPPSQRPVASPPPLPMTTPATDQPIIIPVPPPESGPVAAANTGIGGPLIPRPIAPPRQRESTPRNSRSPMPAPPSTPTAATPPNANAALIATANLPTVRIAPTPGSVPPPLASRSGSAAAEAATTLSTPPLPPPTPRPPAPTRSASPPPSAVTATGFAYRLVAYADTSQAQAAVRSLIPDAFRVMYNGRVVWQAGLFRAHEIDQARSLQQQLRQMNIQTVLLTAQ